MRQYAIAVSGGIGSGKSVVCRILAALGYPVYDSDTRAKELMDNSVDIRQRIFTEISPDALDNRGRIDRKALAAIVFSDPDKLVALNQIVHSSVLADISQWLPQQSTVPCFIETALLYQSGMDRMVDEVWEVEAPIELKVQRVMARNSLTRSDVEARIASQSIEIATPHQKVATINNDGCHSLLLQLKDLLSKIATK